jgi:hypothetical protein
MFAQADWESLKPMKKYAMEVLSTQALPVIIVFGTPIVI